MAFIFLSIAVLFASLAYISCSKEEADVIRKLLSNVDRNVRPVSDASSPVEVKIESYLLSIRNIDEDKGLVELGLWVGLSWNDSSLTWKPFSKKINKVVVPSNNVWTPDVFLESEKGVNEERLRHSSDYDVSIAPNGEVYYLRSVIATLPLKKNGKSWETNFLLEPWNSDKSLQTFHTSSKKMDLSLFTENAKYDLKSNSFAIREISYPDTPDETYVAAEVKLAVQKK